MLKHESSEPTELVFRTFLPWLLLKMTILMAIGTFFFVLGMQTSTYVWWSGSVITALMIAVLTSQYFAQAIIISNNEVVFQNGWLSVEMVVVPIWEIYPETQQNILGRFFDYGTVLCRHEDHMIALKSVASLQMLLRILSQRRQALLPLRVPYTASVFMY